MGAKHAVSRKAGYFAALYEANPEPWNFTASPYEHAKYAATIAALGGRHFERGFEIGCSIGMLTRRLAPYCGALLASDIVETALGQARRNCADINHVSFANICVPAQWPRRRRFDLILCSEVLYFLSPADIAKVAARAVSSLRPGGVVLLVNYTEQIDEPCSGDKAAEIFIAAACKFLVPSYQERRERFRIDRLERLGFVAQTGRPAPEAARASCYDQSIRLVGLRSEPGEYGRRGVQNADV
jgi:cyclopropane fatty-acyl-phospholipid synthase-like methyltransferase